MTLLRAANAGATFFLELGALAALAALGSWGFRAGSGPIVATGLGVGAALLAALLWGAFVAPKAAVPLPAPLPFILGRAILGLGAVALFAGHPTLALAFAAAVALNAALPAASPDGHDGHDEHDRQDHWAGVAAGGHR